MTKTQIRKGSRVRFTDGPLGLMHDPDGYKFAEPVARPGDVGTYLGPHPTLIDWHMVEVLVLDNAGSLYAPVHRAQFDVDEVASHD